MPLYISVFLDKLARWRRFFKSQFLVDCRAYEKFSIGEALANTPKSTRSPVRCDNGLSCPFPERTAVSTNP